MLEVAERAACLHGNIMGDLFGFMNAVQAASAKRSNKATMAAPQSKECLHATRIVRNRERNQLFVRQRNVLIHRPDGVVEPRY